MGRLGRPAPRSLPIDLIGGRSTWIAAGVVVAVVLIIAMGSSGPTE